MNPQAFAWEQVRAPVLAEDFDELRARLTLLPPASLRPRRVAEDFHVVPIAGVEGSGFDAAAQAVRAVLRDVRGGFAALEHPSHSRAREGVDALLDRLARRPDALRFVAGHSRLGPEGLVLAPVALVFQEEPTSPRQLLQPWVDRPGRRETAATPATESILAPRPERGDPIEDYLRQLLDALGELALLGLARADAHSADRWHELTRYGEAIGFHRVTRPVSALADALEQKKHRARWEPAPAARLALDVAMLVRLALDVSVQSG